MNALVVVDVNTSGVDFAHLPRGLRDAVIDGLGEGRMDEIEVQEYFVLLIRLKLQFEDAGSVKNNLLLTKRHIETKDSKG